MAKDFARVFYKSRVWAHQREYILKRDNYICTEPNCHNTATEVHHIIEINEANIDDINVTLNENNLRSLCHECHTRITNAMKLNDKSKDILTPITFDEDGFPIEINK